MFLLLRTFCQIICTFTESSRVFVHLFVFVWGGGWFLEFLIDYHYESSLRCFSHSAGSLSAGCFLRWREKMLFNFIQCHALIKIIFTAIRGLFHKSLLMPLPPNHSFRTHSEVFYLLCIASLGVTDGDVSWFLTISSKCNIEAIRGPQNMLGVKNIKEINGGWENCLAVKSVHCSCRGARAGRPVPSVTPVPQKLMFSSVLLENLHSCVQTHVQTQTRTYNLKRKK